MLTHLYVLHGTGSNRSLQQGHCAATKAATGHTTAINPRDRQCSFNQLVQLRAAHLVVISNERTQEGWVQDPPMPGRCGASQAALPEGVVTLHHEATKGSVVLTAQGSRCLGCALDLTYHVPRPPEALLAHQLSAR